MTPYIRNEENKYYVEQLKRVTSLKDRRNNNIALEGSYGTGKSSIIRQLINDKIYKYINKPKIISLLSFLCNEQFDDKKENNYDNNDDDRNDISIKIQSEIVKQLYYGEKPNKLRGSGYKRIGRSFWLYSLLLALISCLILLINIFQLNIIELLLDIENIEIYRIFDYKFFGINLFVLSTIILIFTIGFELLMRFLINGNIKHISAENITIQLDDTKPDFDQLIDLLILYFHETHRRVLIFEDLDRFNNVQVFEELRQLNFLLNQNKKFFKIKFIYAIRSDLFENKNYSNEDAPDNVPGMQAKLFDIIISVIPFMSTFNIENELKDEWSKVSNVKLRFHDVAKILGRNTSDMRVVKYFLNQCAISVKTFKPKDESELNNCVAISMMRIFYPDEFRKIFKSKSIIDKLRNAARECKNSICDKNSIDGIIKAESDKIQDALASSKDILPFCSMKEVTIDNKKINIDNGELFNEIYRTRELLKINWDGEEKFYSSREVRELYDNIVKPIMEKKISLVNDLMQKDVFDFVKPIIIKESKSSNSEESIADDDHYEKIRKSLKELEEYPVIRDLIIDDFISEEYVRFIAVSNNDIIASNANEYMYGYVRKNKIDADYYLDNETINTLLDDSDNTDLISRGMYNFYIFDYLISNYQVFMDKFETIMDGLAVDKDTFVRFYGEYCLSHEKTLIQASNDYRINKLGDDYTNIPPLFLTRLLADRFPEEIIKIIKNLVIKNFDIRPILLSVAIKNEKILGENDLDEEERGFIEKFKDFILKNENERKEIFKIFIGNNIKIPSLKDLQINDKDIVEAGNKLKIEYNKENLEYLNDNILMEYLTVVGINEEDIEKVFENTNNTIRKYISRNPNLIIKDKDQRSAILEKIAELIFEYRIALDISSAMKYLNGVSRDALIGILSVARLKRNEYAEIMQKSRNSQLQKIMFPGETIHLKNTPSRVKLVEKLQRLGMVVKQDVGTDTIKAKVLEWEQV